MTPTTIPKNWGAVLQRGMRRCLQHSSAHKHMKLTRLWNYTQFTVLTLQRKTPAAKLAARADNLAAKLISANSSVIASFLSFKKKIFYFENWDRNAPEGKNPSPDLWSPAEEFLVIVSSSLTASHHQGGCILFFWFQPCFSPSPNPSVLFTPSEI